MMILRYDKHVWRIAFCNDRSHGRHGSAHDARVWQLHGNGWRLRRLDPVWLECVASLAKAGLPTRCVASTSVAWTRKHMRLVVAVFYRKGDRAWPLQTRVERLRSDVFPVFAWGCTARRLRQHPIRTAEAARNIMTTVRMRTHCIEPDTWLTWHIKSRRDDL